MKRFVIVMLLIVCVIANFSFASADGFSFAGGVTFGMTKDEVVNVYSKNLSVDDHDYIFTVLKEENAIQLTKDKDYDLDFCFGPNSKLERISYYTNVYNDDYPTYQSAYNDLVSLFKEKYGEPTYPLFGYYSGIASQSEYIEAKYDLKGNSNYSYFSTNVDNVFEWVVDDGDDNKVIISVSNNAVEYGGANSGPMIFHKHNVRVDYVTITNSEWEKIDKAIRENDPSILREESLNGI